MDLFIYSDESGVFDYKHNEIFVFGGLIFLGKNQKDIAIRKYLHAERCLRHSNTHSISEELKACKITTKEKNKLFRSLNNYYKFGVVIHQSKVLTTIFDDKKSKQRYLDYAYKISLKKALLKLMSDGVFSETDIYNIRIFVDEHTTATNGKYELKEAIAQELKHGTYTYNYQKFYAPILPRVQIIELSYCNSYKNPLIRASDIIANKIYISAINNKLDTLLTKTNFYIEQLPDKLL